MEINYNNIILTRILFDYIDDMSIIYKLIASSTQFLNVYRNIDVRYFIKKGKTKEQKLQIFINYYKYLPKQGSAEWLKNKKGNANKPPTIGGSEMHELIHSPRALIEKKLTPTPFIGNIHTRWGNVFEEVLSMIIDLLLNSSSEELGSIPGLKDDNDNVIQAYSPDRLLIVSKDRLKNILFAIFNSSIKSYYEEYMRFHETADEKLIILNEFKCPSVRIPDGTIPKEYIYQPPTGACTIPIVDISLFVNASFRKCRIEEFAFNNSYDINFHEKDRINIPQEFDNPIFMGFIGIYDINNNQNIDALANNLIIDLHDDNHSLNNNISNIVTFLYKCLDLMNLSTSYTTKRDEILLSVVDKSIVNDSSKQIKLDLIRLMIPDIIQLHSNIIDNKNNPKILQKLCGIDLGKLPNGEIDSIFKKVVDNRMGLPGYQAYYNDEFLYDSRVAKFLGNDIHQPDTAQWIQNQLEKFRNFCQVNNYKPIGYLPWKLFRICMIPVMHDPNFLENHKEKIFNVVDIIQTIKQKAKIECPNGTADELKYFYKNELNSIYSPKRTVNRTKKNKSDEYTVTDELINEFLDLV